MKYSRLAVLAGFIIAFTSTNIYAEDILKWARVKVNIKKPCQEDWDNGLETDVIFLKEVEKLTTLKFDMKVNVVTLQDLDEMVKYPLLYMRASRPPVLSAKEQSNLREYLKRGGVLFGDDNHEGSGGLGTEDEFYRGMKQIMEEQIFPGRKMEFIPLDHEIFHCHFDLPFGWPVCAGEVHNKDNNVPLGMFAEKDKHLMVLIYGGSLMGGWSTTWECSAVKKRQAYKAGVNLIVYSMTH
ncbi:MAG: hypothetical protein A2231_05190 [Candidatus Firestonebacteria bacterium RIFOXYA2_FULL_40_8]|nr:MAG: hypothetical protein A2231_05190 [Candidatus Firestonebacteria bacterium RIFOXYA2_FULL_40_8]